jgi:hypothetical protein
MCAVLELGDVKGTLSPCVNFPGVAALLVALVFIEVLILALNGLRCPIHQMERTHCYTAPPGVLATRVSAALAIVAAITGAASCFLWQLIMRNARACGADRFTAPCRVISRNPCGDPENARFV